MTKTCPDCGKRFANKAKRRCSVCSGSSRSSMAYARRKRRRQQGWLRYYMRRLAYHLSRY